MAKSNANYSILVDVELQTKQIQKELDKFNGKINIDVKDNGSLNNLVDATEQVQLGWQESKAILMDSLKIIQSMVDEVYTLDASITEFSKVSDLSGDALQSYVDDLTEAGKQVARTGRPLCLSRKVRMVNVL